MIDSPETMLAAIRRCGILPFFKNSVPGWSVEEMTAPGCWFFDNGADGILGPWDWKVDVVQTGEIAYGKFIGGKAAFATVEWYRELMNWRRSNAKYAPKGTLEPIALDAIRGAGSLGSKEIRLICNAAQGKEAAAKATKAAAQSKKVAGKAAKKYAQSKETEAAPVKKATVDTLLKQLQMGTWTVIGDIQRVYRGPQLEYKGWQLASNTTPEAIFGIGAAEKDEALFGISPGTASSEPGTAIAASKPDAGAASEPNAGAGSSSTPFWARRFEEDSVAEAAKPLTPEQSLEKLITHVQQLYPSASLRDIEKLLR